MKQKLAILPGLLLTYSRALVLAGIGCWLLLTGQELRANSPAAPDCEVVIAEASLGGVAAAIQSARTGARTCLTSMTNWVGGQMSTQGVSAIDEPYHFSRADSHADSDFLKKYAHPVAPGRWEVTRGPGLAPEFYSEFPHTDEVLRTLKPVLSRLKLAGCWVSGHCFRPSDADRALKEEMEPWIRKGLLKVFYETVPKRVVKSGAGIESVEFVSRHYTGRGDMPYSVFLSQEIEDWYTEKNSDRYSKSLLKLKAKIFIDATETGELIVLSGARHRQGVDGESGQAPNAECLIGFVYPINLIQREPNIAVRSFLSSFLPSSTSESVGFDITANRERADAFKFWEDDPLPGRLSVFDYRKISDSPPITAMNWEAGNDFSDLNLIVPLAKLGSQLQDWRGGLRIEALAAAERRALGFAAWLSTQPSVEFAPGPGSARRNVTPLFDLSDPANSFGTGTGLSKFPYLRESRRIEGYGGFMIPSQDIVRKHVSLGQFPDAEYTNYFDSVGIGAYPVDTRRCPGGGDISAEPLVSNHYQIPLRALVSANVPNLMVANKTLAVSQLASAAFRLHPTEWNAGYGAGTAAAVAVRSKVDAHGLLADPSKVAEIQRTIVANEGGRKGGRVLWFSDALPPKTAR